MKTNVWFKENGKTLMYSADSHLSHKQAVEHLQAYGHKPEGAVLLTYQGAQQ